MWNYETWSRVFIKWEPDSQDFQLEIKAQKMLILRIRLADFNRSIQIHRFKSKDCMIGNCNELWEIFVKDTWNHEGHRLIELEKFLLTFKKKLNKLAKGIKMN